MDGTFRSHLRWGPIFSLVGKDGGEKDDSLKARQGGFHRAGRGMAAARRRRRPRFPAPTNETIFKPPAGVRDSKGPQPFGRWVGTGEGIETPPQQSFLSYLFCCQKR